MTDATAELKSSEELFVGFYTDIANGNDDKTHKDLDEWHKARDEKRKEAKKKGGLLLF